MSAVLSKIGIPGWTFDKKRDPTFEYRDEPHEYHLQGKRLWNWSAVAWQVRWINLDWYKEEHRYRGSYVHRARHLLDQGTWTIDQCAPEYRPFLDAYLEAKHVWKIKPRLSEKPIYHPLLRYGVTPDCEGEVLGGEPAILEFKSGHMLWWTAYQTAAEDMGVQAWDANPIHRLRIGIELGKNGKFRAKEFTERDDYDMWQAGLKASQAFPEPGVDPVVLQGNWIIPK